MYYIAAVTEASFPHRGAADAHQLGHGPSEHIRMPCLIESLPNERVIDIAASLQHCLLITELGNVFAWGKNSSGEVDSSGDSVVVPVLVGPASGNGGFSVACGAFEVCHFFPSLLML